MAGKSNIYRGKVREAQAIIEKINENIILWEITDNGIKTIGGYLTQESKKIRDEVCIMQGKLEVLCDGLDKSSKKKKQYGELLNLCIQFLSETR